MCGQVQNANSAPGPFGAQMPECIFASPNSNPYQRAKVGVFSFQNNNFAERTGLDAARAVYHHLLENKVFFCVVDEITPRVKTRAEILEVAQAKGYDLIITGEVLYYFEGSEFMPSKVKEAILVLHVPTARILWFALAEDVAFHRPCRDFLLFQIPGRTAAPASDLIDKNAEKFCNMILTHPAQCEMEPENAEQISDPYQTELEELKVQNALLEKALFKEDEKNKALAEHVDTLSSQADQLEEQLREEIDKGHITLKRGKSKTVINIDNRICFGPGSDVLKEEAKKALRKISPTLSKIAENNIQIQGHTDNVPIRTERFSSNWELSSARSLAVLRYLLDHSKINPERLSVAGYGEYHPLRPNDSIENKRLNRRVEIVIVPGRLQMSQNKP